VTSAGTWTNLQVTQEVVVMAPDEAIELGQLVRHRAPAASTAWGIIVGLVFAKQLEALVRWQGTPEATFERLDSLIDAIQFLL
jgi:hypothetical protein